MTATTLSCRCCMEQRQRNVLCPFLFAGIGRFPPPYVCGCGNQLINKWVPGSVSEIGFHSLKEKPFNHFSFVISIIASIVIVGGLHGVVIDFCVCFISNKYNL